MGTRERWTIRSAADDDAEAIAALHRASILTACASWYRPAQIRAWVEAVTPDAHRRRMADTRTRISLDDGALCGFCTTSTGAAQVNALYVAPFAMHRGAGQALLADAEEAVLTAGRFDIELHSTLNAADFYRWRGYVDVREESVRIEGTGVALPAIVMRKSLT